MYSCFKADNVVSPMAIVPYSKKTVENEPLIPIIKRIEKPTLISRLQKFLNNFTNKNTSTDLIILEQRLGQYNNTRKLYGRELVLRLREFPYWSGILMKRPHLRCEFTFSDYRKAIIFINLVSEEALLMSHYPKIINSHTKVSITLRTVEVDGISNKDFALAKAIDLVAEKVRCTY